MDEAKQKVIQVEKKLMECLGASSENDHVEEGLRPEWTVNMSQRELNWTEVMGINLPGRLDRIDGCILFFWFVKL